MYRIGKEEIEAVAAVINSRKFFKTETDLRMVCRVEEKLREITGAKYAVMMTSGYAALVSGLVGMGIGPGDEVIVPAYTYVASAMAVIAAGAVPVLAEINESCTLDPADVRRKISPATRAIMPVHIQGFPCDMDALLGIAEQYGLKIIEDACQADGGSYHGRRLGTIGDTGAFSFNYYKIVSAGEGGALLTDSREIYERALIHHDSCAIAYFGNQLDGIREELFAGQEYRANEISAAIMTVQLGRLDGILADLRRNRRIVTDIAGKKYTPAPSNDSDGDCGTTAAFTFESEAAARAFTQKAGIKAWLPIDTGKHVYTNWPFIANKKGAFNAAMDPFLMKENAGLNHNYSKDMCPATLDILSRTAYVAINPDWSEEKAAELAATL